MIVFRTVTLTSKRNFNKQSGEIFIVAIKKPIRVRVLLFVAIDIIQLLVHSEIIREFQLCFEILF